MLPSQPFLPFTFSPLSINGRVIWLFFAFVILVWILATLILEYHWKNYAVGEKKISQIRLSYRIGSAFLLIILFLSVLAYSFS